MNPPPSRRWNTPQPDTYTGRYAQATAATPYQVEKPPWNKPNYIPRKPIPLPQVKSASISSSLPGSDLSSEEQGGKLPRDSFLFLVFSVFCALVPCLAIALGIVTFRLDGKPLSEWGAMVQSVIILVPTIYPVLFAALMSKSLRSIALNCASRGTSLGRLEQLIGSGTVGGTITTAIFLRVINITTVVLLSCWVLSPLGGQAALRMLVMKEVISERIPATVWYRSPNTTPSLVIGSTYARVRPRVDAAYIASLSTIKSIRDQPLDIFNMIKIPWIESLEVSKTMNDGWIPVEEGRSEAYATLLGVPWQVVRDDGNQTMNFELPPGKANFSMEASYIRFDCDQPQLIPLDKAPSHLREQIKFKPNDQEWKSFVLNMSESDWLSGRVDTVDVVKSKRRIEFLGRSVFVGNETHYNYAACAENTIHVECLVTCIDRSCGITAMRPSRRSTLRPEISYLDGLGSVQSNTLFIALSKAGINHQSSSQITPSENYLVNPDSAFSRGAYSTDVPKIYKLRKEEFSRRFSTIVNTYNQLILSSDHASGLLYNLSAFDPPLDTPSHSTIPAKYLLPTAENATVPVMFAAKRSKTEFITMKQCYSVSRHWLFCFIVSGIFLFVISSVGVILQFTRKSPDIFWISGMARDSPYILLSGKDDVSTLDGDQKSRRLRDLRVIIADVDPEGPLGRIALVAMDEKENNWRKLSSERRYR